MKKIFNIAIVALITLALTGCKIEKTEDNDDIHSFEGTIIECENASMIVRPKASESEYSSSNRFRVEYVNDFNSCNVGTNVKITYDGFINESYPAQIGTTKIEVLPEVDFKLTFNSKPGKVRKQIVDKKTSKKYDYNVYLWNGDVKVLIDNKTYSLEEAIENDSITVEEIIAKAEKDIKKPLVYRDGGSKEYHYDDYTIIKLNILDGNKDVYIGNKKLSVNDVA